MAIVTLLNVTKLVNQGIKYVPYHGTPPILWLMELELFGTARVQDYRDKIKHVAHYYKLVGYIKNDIGRCKLEAMGTEKRLNQFKRWLTCKSPLYHLVTGYHSCVSNEIPNMIPERFHVLPLVFKNARRISVFNQLKREDDSRSARKKMFDFALSKKSNRFEKNIWAYEIP